MNRDWLYAAVYYSESTYQTLSLLHCTLLYRIPIVLVLDVLVLFYYRLQYHTVALEQT